MLALMLSAGPSWKADFSSHFAYVIFPPLSDGGTVVISFAANRKRNG